MDYYDFNRARAMNMYSQIETMEKELEFIYEKCHRQRVKNIIQEIKLNESLKNKKIQMADLINSREQLIDTIKNLASKVIVSNLKIYTAKNQSINTVAYGSKMFRVKKNIKYTKPTKQVLKHYNEDKIDNDIIFLKTETNKIFLKFWTKWHDFKNNKLDKIVVKEKKEIRIAENRIRDKNHILNKKIEKIRKLEISTFKSEEYLKLNARRDINKNTYWDIEIKILSRKHAYAKSSYESAIKIINEEYKEIFENNKIEEICPICLEEDKRYVKTSCGHSFHVECICSHIHRLLSSNNIEITCPMCRQIML